MALLGWVLWSIVSSEAPGGERRSVWNRVEIVDSRQECLSRRDIQARNIGWVAEGSQRVQTLVIGGTVFIIGENGSRTEYRFECWVDTLEPHS